MKDPLLFFLTGTAIAASEYGFKFTDSSDAMYMWGRVMFGAVLAFFMEVSLIHNCFSNIHTNMSVCSFVRNPWHKIVTSRVHPYKLIILTDVTFWDALSWQCCRTASKMPYLCLVSLTLLHFKSASSTLKINYSYPFWTVHQYQTFGTPHHHCCIP